MRTESKAQGIVRTLLSVNIEHIRVGKHVVIPVCGLVGSNNALARTNELDCVLVCVPNGGNPRPHLSAQLDILLRHPLHCQCRACVVTAQLCNETVDKRGVSDELFQLLRVLRQCDNALGSS